MLQMRDATERTLQLPIQMRRTKHVQSDELTVSFDDAAIHEWTLGLCLLKEGLVSRLIVTELKPSFRLEIRLDESLPREKRAMAVPRKDALRLELSCTELDYWLYFFLRYVRDGRGEGNHLDIETTVGDASKRPIDVVLEVTKLGPPISVEEAKRQLGMR